MRSSSWAFAMGVTYLTSCASWDNNFVAVRGPAYTVQMVKANDTNAPTLESHFVDTVVKGAVVVIDAPRGEPDDCLAPSTRSTECSGRNSHLEFQISPTQFGAGS